MVAGNKKIVIIGAGPCGLGAAWRLHELGLENYETVKEAARQAHRKGCETYKSSNALWEHNDFMSRLDRWAQERRTIYTRLVRQEKQLLLDFARPDSVLYTNRGVDPEMTQQFTATGNHAYLNAEKVIALAHGRGKSELTNRAFKKLLLKP
jgi:thioredoxin reductase